jgi:hypothetical protein
MDPPISYAPYTLYIVKAVSGQRLGKHVHNGPRIAHSFQPSVYVYD